MKLGSSFGRKALIIPLVAIVGAFSGCMQSPQAKSAKYLAAGKSLLEKHDTTRALLQFRNAMRATPDNPEVYYEMGLAYTAARDYSVAAAALRKALELNPKYVAAQLKLSQILAATSDRAQQQEALNRLKTLLKNTPATPEIMNTLAFAQLKLGDTESAVQNLDRVLAQSPQQLDASAMLAAAKMLEHDPKGAEEILKKACADSPKSADARRVLGEFYSGQKDNGAAEAQFQAALQIDSKNGPALMDLSRLQLIEGRKQDAELNFRRLAAFPGFKPVHALFLFQEGQRDEGIREFEKLFKDNPGDRIIRTDLVVAYRLANRKADADKLLAKALKENPKDVDALQQRGELALEAGKYVDAESDLNQVLRLKPAEPEVHYLLAKVSQARGATLTYRQELSSALQLNPNLMAVRLELAHSNLTNNASGAHAALDLLDQVPDSQKEATPILVERNWALWTLGDLAEMRKGIDRGLARERSPDLLIQDGVWKLRSNDPAGARKSLEEALKIDPSDLRALQALNQTYIAQKNAPMALEKVKEYAAQQPKSAPVQDFLGMLLIAQGDKTHARAAFTAAKNADPLYVKSDLALVQVDALDGKLDDARKRLEGILSAEPNNPTARLWLGNIEASAGRPAAALDQFRKVADSNPDNAQASNNLAYMLAEYSNKPDDALKYAERAVQLAPEQPEYCDTIGWILYRKGLYSQAVGYLERAGANKGDVVWKYHLAMAYAKSGDPARGRTTLDAALKINPTVPEAKLAKDLLGQAK